jgi:hypothetical protein
MLLALLFLAFRRFAFFGWRRLTYVVVNKYFCMDGVGPYIKSFTVLQALPTSVPTQGPRHLLLRTSTTTPTRM